MTNKTKFIIKLICVALWMTSSVIWIVRANYWTSALPLGLAAWYAKEAYDLYKKK